MRTVPRLGVEMLVLLADPSAVGLGPLPKINSRRAWVAAAATAIKDSSPLAFIEEFQHALRQQFPAYRGPLVDPANTRELAKHIAGRHEKRELRAMVDGLIGDLARYPNEALGAHTAERLRGSAA
jgi:hypothetical protein